MPGLISTRWISKPIEEARKMARRTQQVLHERSASGTQLHQLHLLRLSELLPLRHTPNTQKLSKNLVDLGDVMKCDCSLPMTSQLW